MQVKKGDNVVVITGKDKGKEGKITNVNPGANRVIVDGVNIQKRHTKPRSAQKPGGILDQAGAIDASNVMVFCPQCKKGVRVSMQVAENGDKYRACHRCKLNLDAKEAAPKKEKATAKKKEKKAE